MRPTEIEDVLADGERLLWEGRPVKYVMTRRRFAVLTGLFLMLVALPLEHLLFSVPRGAAWSWSIGFWTVRVSGATATKSGSFVWLNPVLYLGTILVFVAWSELQRLARVRRYRFGITNRRALLIDPHGKIDALERPRITSTEVLGADFVIHGKTTTITFNGLLDPLNAQSALSADARLR